MGSSSKKRRERRQRLEQQRQREVETRAQQGLNDQQSHLHLLQPPPLDSDPNANTIPSTTDVPSSNQPSSKTVDLTTPKPVQLDPQSQTKDPPAQITVDKSSSSSQSSIKKKGKKSSKTHKRPTHPVVQTSVEEFKEELESVDTAQRAHQSSVRLDDAIGEASNQSQYLSTLRQGQTLMSDMMRGFGPSMDTDLVYYITGILGVHENVLECMNLMFINTPHTMMQFSRDPDYYIRRFPATVLTHPMVFPACGFLCAFGQVYLDLQESFGSQMSLEHVMPEHIQNQLVSDQLTGIHSRIEGVLAKGLQQYYDVFRPSDTSVASSKRSYRSRHSSNRKPSGASVQSPIIIETTSDASTPDDASDLTNASQKSKSSKPQGKKTRFKSPSEGSLPLVREDSHPDKGGIQSVPAPNPVDLSVHPEEQSSKKQSPFSGTLIDLTKVSPEVASNILHQLNVSKISPKSGDSPVDLLNLQETKSNQQQATSMLDPTQLQFDPQKAGTMSNKQPCTGLDHQKASMMTQRSTTTQPGSAPPTIDTSREDLYRLVGTTPDGRPVSSSPPSTLTPRDKEIIEYMQKIKALTPDSKDVKRASLPSSCKFTGDTTKFEEFRNTVEGHYRQQQASYLFNKDFVKAYTEHGSACYVMFEGISSPGQVRKDVEALYGAIQQSCQKGMAKTILLKYADTSNGVAAWQDICKEFDHSGDPKTKASELEIVVSTPFSNNYKGGLVGWVKDYENAFAELEVLGKTSFVDDDSKKDRLLQNYVDPTSKEYLILEKLTADMNFKELCTFLRSHGIKKSKSILKRRANQSTADHSESTNATLKDLAKSVASLVKQNHHVSDPCELIQAREFMAQLTRIEPNVWKQLPRDIQEYISKGRAAEREKAKKEEPKKSGSNKTGSELPRQYNRQANLTQVEDEEDDILQEYLNEALGTKGASDDDIQTNAFNTITRTVEVSISEERVISCMNSLVIEDQQKLVIMDNGADTSVIGKGWDIIAVHPTRKAHVIGFDHKAAVKKNLDIVSAVTAVDINDHVYLLQINEAVSNPSAEHSLLSEYQVRDFGTSIDSVPRKHGGTQRMNVGDVDIPFGVHNCLIHFKSRHPTVEELDKIQPIVLSQGDIPWNPRSQEHNSPIDTDFHQEVIAAAKADALAELEEQEDHWAQNVILGTSSSFDDIDTNPSAYYSSSTPNAAVSTSDSPMLESSPNPSPKEE